MLRRNQVAARSACRLFIILIYLITGFFCPGQAGAAQLPDNQSVSESEELDQITRAALHKQVELERLNTHFRIETTLVSPWRQRRVFAYGESNASLVAAGLITALPVRYNLARKKVALPPADNKNRSRLAAAARIQLVGQCIGAGGDVLELSLNFIHYYVLRHKGFNPAGYRKKVQTMEADLDKLLDERQSILNHSSRLSARDIEAAQLEGQLLGDLRDLSLVEYQQYLAATKRFWAFQNTAFVVDFLKNGTGAAGNIVALEANHIHRPHMIGTAFLLSTISGALVIVTPIVGRVTGNMSGAAAEKTSSRELVHVHTNNAETYLSDKDQFIDKISVKTADSPYMLGVNQRKIFYDQQGELYLSQKKFLDRQRKNARSTLTENILFAAVVGPPRIANGTLGMIGSWHYYNNSPDRNRCYAAGTTAYLAGTTFNMLETARVQASIELSNRRLAKSNLLPRQQFTNRLQILENMDQSLNK